MPQHECHCHLHGGAQPAQVLLVQALTHFNGRVSVLEMAVRKKTHLGWDWVATPLPPPLLCLAPPSLDIDSRSSPLFFLQNASRKRGR